MAENDKFHTWLLKNALPLFGIIAAAIAFYTATGNRVDALENDVDSIEKTLLLVTQNQSSILLLQQEQGFQNSALETIEDDIKDIKKALNILEDGGE